MVRPSCVGWARGAKAPLSPPDGSHHISPPKKEIGRWVLEVDSREADVGEQAIVEVTRRAQASSRGRPGAPEHEQGDDSAEGGAHDGARRPPGSSAGGD